MRYKLNFPLIKAYLSTMDPTFQLYEVRNQIILLVKTNCKWKALPLFWPRTFTALAKNYLSFNMPNTWKKYGWITDGHMRGLWIMPGGFMVASFRVVENYAVSEDKKTISSVFFQGAPLLPTQSKHEPFPVLIKSEKIR